MAIYNEKIEWMRQSIDSILNQTFSDFEFIIINDNPQRKDNQLLTSEYSKRDKRIKVMHNEQNIGLTKSLNKGLKIAQGDYIARMDADDIALPKRFEKQVQFLDKNKECIVCGTNISYIGDRNFFVFSDWIKYDDASIKAQLMVNSCFAHPSVMIRKKILVENGIAYDEDYKQAQDYRLWEILSHYGAFGNIKEKLLQYRISQTQVSKKHSGGQQSLAQNIRKRILNTWLQSIGISEQEDNIYTYLLLNKRRIIKEKVQKKGVSMKYFDAFLKYIYFSPRESKLKLFLSFYLTGDFLRMDIITNMRFVAFLIRSERKDNNIFLLI